MPDESSSTAKPPQKSTTLEITSLVDEKRSRARRVVFQPLYGTTISTVLHATMNQRRSEIYCYPYERTLVWLNNAQQREESSLCNTVCLRGRVFVRTYVYMYICSPISSVRHCAPSTIRNMVVEQSLYQLLHFSGVFTLGRGTLGWLFLF